MTINRAQTPASIRRAFLPYSYWLRKRRKMQTLVVAVAENVCDPLN